MKATSCIEYALCAALASLLFTGSASAQQRRSASFETSERNDLCFYTVQGGKLPGTDKPFKFEISYRVSDGNFNVRLLVNGWDKAQAADPDANIPMTLAFDGAGSTTSPSGGYSSGFWDYGWAGWGGGAPSQAPLDMLRRARFVSVVFDGVEYDSIDLQGNEGFAYQALMQCRDRLNAGS
ncbi:MAG: hypothetical protein CMN73_15380 [Sphingomonas sp.]|nr:hypothetical protein [Sphingomonas sp.]|tara:strand:- start:3781 stop:4320 length:540 start_codon:yes stop_codon:yes gene_type:complete